MPQPTPLVQEINRLMRVDRTARELANTACKQIGAERIEAWRYGQLGRAHIRVPAQMFVKLLDALEERNERCPNIVYPDREFEELIGRLRSLPEGRLAELLAEFKAREAA